MSGIQILPEMKRKVARSLSIHVTKSVEWIHDEVALRVAMVISNEEIQENGRELL